MQQLKMLREVSERGTISAAAEALSYTPSAISQQLASLERSTGVAVLERVGRNVRLTDAGRELVRHADGLLAGMEAARVALERVSGEVRGTVELTVFESIANTLLPRLLVSAAQRYPDLTITAHEREPDQSLTMLAKGDVDLVFAIDYSHAPIVPADGIEFDTVLTEPFRMIVPPGTSGRRRARPLSDFADRDFIHDPTWHSCGRCVTEACRVAGFEPRLAHAIETYPVVARLVEAGQGVALMASLGVSDALERGVQIDVVDLEPEITRTVMLGFRSASAERPAVRAVRDLVAEIAADYAAGPCQLAS